MTDFVDPPEPPDPDAGMKAKNLKNRVCLFRPTAMGEWPAKEAEGDEKAKAAQPYVECDVWVLESEGVVEEGTGVRVGWWRAVEQLKDSLGKFVGGKPVEQDDRSVVLVPLSGSAREVAGKVVASLSGTPSDGTENF